MDEGEFETNLFAGKEAVLAFI